MLRYPAKAYIIPKRWTKLSQIKIPQHGINTDTVKGAIDLNGIFIHRKRVFGDIEVPPGTHVSLYFNSIILRELVSPDWNLLNAEEKDYIVIDKPAGLPLGPPNDAYFYWLVPYMKSMLGRKYASTYIQPTSRLDQGTHGLIVVATNPEFTVKYNDLLVSRSVSKTYETVVTGWTAGHDKLVETLPLRREDYIRHDNDSSHTPIRYEDDEVQASIYADRIFDPFAYCFLLSDCRNKGEIVDAEAPKAKHCILEITDVGDVTEASLPLRPFPKKFRQNICNRNDVKKLRINLITGKTHQIRLQMVSLGLTVVGDWLYGAEPEASLTWTSLALCCSKLSFKHPYEDRDVKYELK